MKFVMPILYRHNINFEDQPCSEANEIMHFPRLTTGQEQRSFNPLWNRKQRKINPGIVALAEIPSGVRVPMLGLLCRLLPVGAGEIPKLDGADEGEADGDAEPETLELPP